MTAEKFKLFIGYLGNGATVCNSAVYEHGDYKQIAHISNAGNIKLYVKPDYIPEDAMERIEETAASHRAKTEKRLDLELSTDYGYYRILDEIGDYTSWSAWRTFFDDLKATGDHAAKVEKVKQYYLSKF